MPLEFLHGEERTRWKRASFKFRRANPWCLSCFSALGLLTRATIVDHVVPHSGDFEKFWNMENLQPVCGRCHNVVKRELEARWRRSELSDADLRLDSSAAIKLTKLHHRPHFDIDGYPIPGT
jgi:5-methylcytosine-specific restriction enzyme A